jgi:hypothetical protein
MGRFDAAAAEADDTQVWARVLSLTGALLSHMAANPQTHRLVTDMLSAGMARGDGIQAEPFAEPLVGLHTRELRSPEVLQHFFGV